MQSIEKWLAQHKAWDVVKDICVRLQQAGYKAVLAGGCVRDALLGQVPKDLDVATSATPDEVARLFPKSIGVGKAFGVMIVPTPQGPVELATFRSDGPYQDGRRPENVAFSSMEADAQRRDFTVNALFYDLFQSQIHDFVGGLADLRAKRLNTVGDPNQRFAEDKLRILRAIRFSAQTEFNLEPAVWQAVLNHRTSVLSVSRERIKDELMKMLALPRAHSAIDALARSGLLATLWPELHAAMESGAESPWSTKHLPIGRHCQMTMRITMTAWPEASPLHKLILFVLPLALQKPDALREWWRVNKFANDERKTVESSIQLLQRLRTWPTLAKAQKLRLIAEPEFNQAFAVMQRLLLSEDDEGTSATASTTQVESLSLRTEVQSLLPLLVGGKLPRHLLNGNDLIRLGCQPGPQHQQILNALMDEQLEGRLTEKSEAETWVRKTFWTG